MDNSIQAHQKELCNKLWAMAKKKRSLVNRIVDFIRQHTEKFQ